MKRKHLMLFVILLGAIAASGQDCKPDDFEFLKVSVLRITSQHIWTGLDEKAFNRAGDLAAIAIVKSIPENELMSPTTTQEVLGILHSAFACPVRCITSLSNRQPDVAMLLLEHLYNHASKSLQSEVEKTRDYIVRQTTGAWDIPDKG